MQAELSFHILGGTLVAIILGPYAGMLSMIMVLGMQAFFFADGGLLAFGANTLNMAIIGGPSFFIIKFLASKTASKKRFAASVFITTFSAATLTGNTLQASKLASHKHLLTQAA